MTGASAPCHHRRFLAEVIEHVKELKRQTTAIAAVATAKKGARVATVRLGGGGVEREVYVIYFS